MTRKATYSVHVTHIAGRYGGSYAVEVRKSTRKNPVWSAQYGALKLENDNPASLALFAGNQVKRQCELGIQVRRRLVHNTAA